MPLKLSGVETEECKLDQNNTFADDDPPASITRSSAAVTLNKQD